MKKLLIALVILGVIIFISIFLLSRFLTENGSENTTITNIGNFAKRTIEISGNGMSPNYINGQYYEIDYNPDYQPQRGDVVLMQLPSPNEGVSIAKRVIGLPKEEIEINNNQVYVNGLPISEPYLPTGTVTYALDFLAEAQKKTIPPDQYFLLGDNRMGSTDSRTWGFITKQQIEGKLLSCTYNCPSK